VLKEILEQENIPSPIRVKRGKYVFAFTKDEIEKITEAWMLIEIERKLDGGKT
jgi:hypothetical protein